MDITLEMVDQVRERTGATYEEARAALEAAGGNVVDAIVSIEQGTRSAGSAAGDIMEKIKAAIQKGNVTKIRISKGEQELLTVPVTAGAAVGVVGLLAAPGAVVLAAIAGVVGKYGFDCKYEIIKDDGTIDVL